MPNQFETPHSSRPGPPRTPPNGSSIAPPDEGPGGPVPVDNRHGHHPRVEQDKPQGPPPSTARRGRRVATLTTPAPPEREDFPFLFDSFAGLATIAVGVRRDRALVRIDGDRLEVRYGPWHLDTPLANVVDARVTGPYSPLKVGGPPRLSLRDRGITFATNADAGVCLRFAEPVPAALPFGLVRHPGATVTVADPFALVAALEARNVVVSPTVR